MTAGFITPDAPTAAINSSPDSALNVLGAADVDRDGIDDAFIATRSSPQNTQSSLVNILWYHGTGSGFFEPTSRWLAASPERLPNYYVDPSTQAPVRPKWQILAADITPGGNLEFAYLGQALPGSEARVVVGSVARTVSANLGEIFNADIAGTGRNEVLRVRRVDTGLRIERSAATGSSPTSDTLPVFLDEWAAYFFDYDSPSCSSNCSGAPTGRQDGKEDLLILARDKNGMSFIVPALSRGDGTFLTLTPQAVSLSAASPRSWIVGDSSGDGVDELLHVAAAGAATTVTMITRGATAASWTVTANNVPVVGAPIRRFAVDVDADQAVELVILSRGSAGDQIETLKSVTGTWQRIQTFAIPAAAANRTALGQWGPLDFNQDGVADFFQIRARWNGFATVDLLVGNGNSDFTLQQAEVDFGGRISEAQRWTPVDLNGDGEAELRAVMPPELFAASQTPHGAFAVVARSTSGGWSGALRTSFCVNSVCASSDEPRPHTLLDIDADTVAEFAALRFSSGVVASRWKWPSANHLLQTVDNGLGYRASVSYTSSAGKHEGFLAGVALPVVAVIEDTVTVGNAGPIPQSAQKIQRAVSWSGLGWDFESNRARGFSSLAIATSEVSSTGVPSSRRTGSVFSRDACPGRLIEEWAETPTETVREITVWNNRSLTGPYRHCVERARWTQYASGRRTNARFFERNDFGEAVVTRDFGEFVALPGDIDAETSDNFTITTAFAAPGSSYVASRPYSKSVVEDSTSLLLSSELYGYDNAPIGATVLRGNETSRERWDDEHNSFLTWAKGYDQFGNVTFEESPEGRRNDFQYDPRHGLFREIECNSSFCVRTRWNYEAEKPAEVLGPNGSSHFTYYDQLARIRRETWSNGECVDFSYLDFGTPSQRSRVDRCGDSGSNDGAGNGLWVDRFLDGLGRVVRSVRSSGAHSEVAFFGFDTNLESASSDWNDIGKPPTWTFTSRDARGQVVVRTDPDGATTRVSSQNGTQTQTDQIGRVQITFTDGRGRTATFRELHDGNTLDTTYAYTWDGELRVLTDPQRFSATIVRTTTGRRLQECDPARGCRNHSHYADGLLASTTDANGASVSFEYDALGRRTLKSNSDGTWTRWYFDVDSRGGSVPNGISRLVATETRSGVTEQFDYDARGRPAKTRRCIGQDCAETEKHYGRSGLLRFVVYPDSNGFPGGEVVEYQNDIDGRVSSVVGYAPQVAIDARDRLRHLTFENGAISDFGFSDLRNWAESARSADASGTAAFDISYSSYNEAGLLREREIIDSQGNRNFTVFDYDDLGRLERESPSNSGQQERFSYDDIGNIRYSSRNGDYKYKLEDKPYTLTGTDLGTTSHDEVGNMLVNSDGTQYRWSVDGLLQSADSPTTGTTQFDYTADGQRIIKAGPWSETVYFDQLVERRNGQWVNIIYIGSTPIAERSGSDVKYFHTDASRNVRAATDRNGSLIGTADFSSYGERSTNLTTELAYTAHHEDSETGLLYLNARYLDPRLGRFISADSIDPLFSISQAQNRFAYGSNNPISHVDLDGHVAWLVVAVIWAGMIIFWNEGDENASIGVVIPGAAEIAPVATSTYLIVQSVKGNADGVENLVDGTRKELAGQSGQEDFDSAKMNFLGAGFDALGARMHAAVPKPTVSTMSASEFVDWAVREAKIRVGPGKGPQYGTKLHKEVERIIKASGRSDVHAEVSYLDGEIVSYGTKDSSRVDVVFGPKDAPTGVKDLKTGSAKLDPNGKQVGKMRNNLPNGGQIPIEELR